MIEAGGDYVLSLQGKQGNLHEDVEQLFQWTRQQKFEGLAQEFYQTLDAGHGRVELRRHWWLNQVDHLIDGTLWQGLKRVGLVESERRLPGQAPTIEQRY